MPFNASEIESLTEAFRSVLTLKNRGRGVLRVAAGAVKGSFNIDDGIIVAARVVGTSLENEAALKRLMDLDQCVVAFTEMEELNPEEKTCHISLMELLRAPSEPQIDNVEDMSSSFLCETRPIAGAGLKALLAGLTDAPMAEPSQNQPERETYEEAPKDFSERATASSRRFSQPQNSDWAPLPDLKAINTAQDFIDEGAVISQSLITAESSISAHHFTNNSGGGSSAEITNANAKGLPAQIAPVEVQQESALSEQQRELLAQVSLFSDSELFHEPSAELQKANHDVPISEKHDKLLHEVIIDDLSAWDALSPELQKPQENLMLGPQHRAMAKKAQVDKRSIEERNNELEEKPSLDETKKQLLDLVSSLADEEVFGESDEVLNLPNELIIDNEARQKLEELAKAKSLEEQRQEFAQSDKKLAEALAANKLSEFKEFQDYSALDQIPTPDVERTPLEVLPSDSDPLLPPAPKPEFIPKERGGIIGRIQGALDRRKIAIYEGPRASDGPQIAHLIGPSILVLLCVALFIVPATMRTTISRAGAPAIAREQMQLVMQDEMQDAIPYAQHDLEEQVQAPNAGMLNPDAPDTYEARIRADELTNARWLASKGRTAQAADAYEKYLNQNPDSVAVRIELIQLFLGQKNKEKARWHCLRGMKSKCDPSELQQFWSLWRQCSV